MVAQKNLKPLLPAVARDVLPHDPPADWPCRGQRDRGLGGRIQPQLHRPLHDHVHQGPAQGPSPTPRPPHQSAQALLPGVNQGDGQAPKALLALLRQLVLQVRTHSAIAHITEFAQKTSQILGNFVIFGLH